MISASVYANCDICQSKFAVNKGLKLEMYFCAMSKNPLNNIDNVTMKRILNDIETIKRKQKHKIPK